MSAALLSSRFSADLHGVVHSPWLTQTTRLYAGQAYAEFEVRRCSQLHNGFTTCVLLDAERLVAGWADPVGGRLRQGDHHALQQRHPERQEALHRQQRTRNARTHPRL